MLLRNFIKIIGNNSTAETDESVFSRRKYTSEYNIINNGFLEGSVGKSKPISYARFPIEWVVAVSYTHLDVYKRQSLYS